MNFLLELPPIELQIEQETSTLIGRRSHRIFRSMRRPVSHSIIRIMLFSVVSTKIRVKARGIIISKKIWPPLLGKIPKIITTNSNNLMLIIRANKDSDAPSDFARTRMPKRGNRVRKGVLRSDGCQERGI